jgi:cell division protein FtsW (lipid II flippase)
MGSILGFKSRDLSLHLSILFLLILSVVLLNSIAQTLFPSYFIYIVIAVIAFWFFSQIGFETVSLFSKHLYVISILLLLLTLIIGSVTRGTVRFIPLGPLSFQPAELIRPFLLVFFANYLTNSQISVKKMVKAIALLILPVLLILVQPSLGVSVLTVVGFFRFTRR